ASMPLRVTAAFRTARRFSDVEVGTAVRRPEFFSLAGEASDVSAPDLCNDRAAGMAGLQGDPDDPSTARLHDVASDDGVFGPVGAFDQYVRLNRGDQIPGRRF